MIFFVDMDGTLSDDRWRREALPDWDAYHAGAPDDKPRPAVLQFLQRLYESPGHGATVICTGRPEGFRGSTLDWLDRHSVPYDYLLMRPNGDYGPTPEVKLALIRAFLPAYAPNLLGLGQHPIILDNSQKVADLLRTEGYEVWMCE